MDDETLYIVLRDLLGIIREVDLHDLSVEQKEVIEKAENYVDSH